MFKSSENLKILSKAQLKSENVSELMMQLNLQIIFRLRRRKIRIKNAA